MILKRNKIILITLILAGITALAFAQVDEVEISNLPPVVFINYDGPHARVDTREEIRQIGVVLGQVIQERERGIAETLAAMTLEERRAYSYRFDAGASGRYWVIHSVSGPENNKLDADVFGLGVDVGVDHIRNLRVILQGYLQAAYNYSASDALLLAEYITIYNAVYRGNWDYFTGRYKTPVIGHLTRDRAGLSIRYDEWPGRTLMLIPLGFGGLNAIDTSALTDSRVIEEMRREDDQGIPQRQQMVDLIERQAEEAAQQAQQERQTAAQQQTQVTEERRQVEQERQTVQESQQQGQITQEEAQQTQQELDRREEELDRREGEIEERLEEADRLEEYAQQRQDEAQQQREEIARDQQAGIQQPAQTTPVFGISIESSGRTASGMVDSAIDTAAGALGYTSSVITGRLVHLNAQTGSITRSSPLVHVRTITFAGGKILAIAGEATGDRAVRLVELDQNTLEIIKQGSDDIRAGSLIWVNGSDLYAITVNEGRNYIGRFNTDLVLQARSSIEVHTDAGVSIQQGRLLTQRTDGTPLALEPANLTEIRY